MGVRGLEKARGYGELEAGAGDGVHQGGVR